MCVTAGSSMRCSGYRTSMRLRAIRWSERVGKGLSSKTCSRPRRKEQWQASIAPRRGLKSTWCLNCPAEKSGQFKHQRSEEHTSELQSLMRISYAAFSMKKKKKHINTIHTYRPTVQNT